MSRDVVVTLSDANFLEQAKQLFSSIYHNSGWKGDYLLLALGVDEKDMSWFRDRGITVKPIPGIVEGSFSKHPLTILGQFHLFGPDLKRWKKVVFLDADIIVEASLDALSELDGFNAVPDIHFKDISEQFIMGNKGQDTKERMLCNELSGMYDLKEMAFNSGVMVFDTDMIENDGMVDPLRDLYLRFGPIARSDQSILNIFFYGKWKSLPLVYDNYFPYHRKGWRPRFAPTESIVHHFLWDKPWTRDDRHYDKEWKSNLQKADRIDLGHRKGPVRTWTAVEIARQEEFLTSLNKGVGPLMKFLFKLIDRTDAFIGEMGSMIKGGQEGRGG